jgi:hypothetical protein
MKPVADVIADTDVQRAVSSDRKNVDVVRGWCIQRWAPISENV